MRYIKGTDLSHDDQKHVLAAYVHRFTGDNTPPWASKLRPCGNPYPLQFKDDQDWLANTKFAVTKSGSLDKRAHFCESTATWPNGK